MVLSSLSLSSLLSVVVIRDFVVISVIVKRYHYCRRLPTLSSVVVTTSVVMFRDSVILSLSYRAAIYVSTTPQQHLIHCSFRGPNKIVALDLTSVVVVACRVVVSSVLTSTLTLPYFSCLHTFISFRRRRLRVRRRGRRRLVRLDSTFLTCSFLRLDACRRRRRRCVASSCRRLVRLDFDVCDLLCTSKRRSIPLRVNLLTEVMSPS